jgi:hypothetical protein
VTEDPRIRDEIAAFVDRVLMTEAWEESGGEVADRIMRILTEHGWSPRVSEDPRIREIRAGAPVGDTSASEGACCMTESMASEPAEPTTRQDPEVRISPPAFYPQVEIAVRFPDQRHWGVVRRCNTLLYVAPGSGLDKVISEHWGLLADPAQTTEQHAERLDRVLWLWAEEKWRREQLLAQRQHWWDTVGREKAALTEQRDLAVWLHAEAAWRVEGLVGQVNTLGDAADERQARIDAALQLIHVFTATGPHFLSPDEIREVRAALVGDQPTESGQGATLGPRHPAGSPEGHFPTDPQMSGSIGQSTPSGDQPTTEEPSEAERP